MTTLKMPHEMRSMVCRTCSYTALPGNFILQKLVAKGLSRRVCPKCHGLNCYYVNNSKVTADHVTYQALGLLADRINVSNKEIINIVNYAAAQLEAIDDYRHEPWVYDQLIKKSCLAVSDEIHRRIRKNLLPSVPKDTNRSSLS